LRQAIDNNADAAECTLSLSAKALPSAVVSGRIVDGDGKPISAQVCLASWAFGQGGFFGSGPDGMFVSPAMPAGKYDVRVMADGCGTLVLNTVMLQASERRVMPDIVMAPTVWHRTVVW